jgi:hypothetical protein
MTIMSVLPMSPRTTRLAINGIKAIMIDSRTLAMLITITWLEPANACRNDPLNCIGSVISSADISDCRIAYSRPQQWKIIMFTKNDLPSWPRPREGMSAKTNGPTTYKIAPYSA